MVNSEERSKKADEWLQMGAKIERLELAIKKLEKLLSQSGNVQPEIPKDKKKEMEKRDIRLIKSILVKKFSKAKFNSFILSTSPRSRGLYMRGKNHEEGEMIKMLRHQVVINVSDAKGKKVNVLRGGDIKFRDRILNFLLGKEQKMLVLVPSEIVESVAIKEVQR